MNSAHDLFAEHSAYLLGRARRLTRNEADARDLVQDTCLHALEALQRTDTYPENVQAWLSVVMRNHWFNVVRHRKVKRNVSSALAQADACDTGLYDTRIVYRQFERAWDRLPDHARQIAHQCLIEGDSHEEVSRRFGMTVGGIGTSIHRTREHLRQSMAGI